MIDAAADLVDRYRWTTEWAAYITYCIVVFHIAGVNG